VAVLLALPATAGAQVWTEVGDAGIGLAGAQAIGPTTGGAPTTLNTITGTFSNINDMDVYRFRITTPTAFSATTSGGSTDPGLDTMLFLFRSNGTGLAGNDDTSTTDFRSTLPLPVPARPNDPPTYTTLAPGDYLLAVTIWANRPTGTGGASIFGSQEGPDLNAANNPRVFAPVAGEDTDIFTGQNSQGNPANVPPGLTFPTPYTVALTGVAPVGVPEPGTVALCGAAAVAGLAVRRRQKAHRGDAA